MLKKILIMHTIVMVDGQVIKSVSLNLCQSSIDGQSFNIFQWCVAVKNITYIQQSIRAIVTDFGLEAIVTSLVHAGNCNSAEICRQTIRTILDNGVSIVSRKIREMLERAAGKVGILDAESFLTLATQCKFTVHGCLRTLSNINVSYTS
jgi:hypothetical protein